MARMRIKRLLKRASRLSKLPPPAFLAVLYLGLVVAGALLLKLPFANRGGLDWMEAFFTSTSAVTVTGLTVVDTGQSFTLFGQAVILGLIQMGGLGLMTFAVLILTALGLPIGMSHRIILREDLNQTSLGNLSTLARLIFKVACIAELVGIAVLCIVFVPEFGWLNGLWQAIFHTISAFNNAGFGLFPDSLSRWVSNPVINLAIPTMFILGGLGFVVIGDLIEKRRWSTLLLHSKLTLAGTLGLILFSWPVFMMLEWRNPETLAALDGPGARIMAAWFQAVTTRTAGFNTLDIASLHDSTSLMMILLMLVGGGSTSTAGGIKVTSFIVLMLATMAFFKRRTSLSVFGRSLGLEQIMKVMALTSMSLLIVMTAIFIISISHDGSLADLGFEVASAFGTTGLSRGATGELDTLGRFVIMCVMFLGRVGPLTLGFLLATRSQPRVRYPSGQVHLG